MTDSRLNLQRPVRDASWGLRIGVILAVVALGVGFFALRRSAAPGLEAREPALTASQVDAYLTAALDVRTGRREARQAGWAPTTWETWPKVAAALERAGWTMDDYMRVEGQIAAARLELERPGSVHDLDDPNSRPVPDEHLELVRGRLDEVKAAQAPLD